MPHDSIREAIVPAEGRPLSRAVRAGNLIWLSGVTPPPEMLQRGASISEQVEACLLRVGEILSRAGVTFANVVRTTVYLTRQGDFEPMNDVYERFFPTDPPARTTVIAGLVVPGALVEIDAVAISADNDQK